MNFLIKILYLISKLPLKVLYIFSDVMFFLNYYLVGYRKKVITQNLRKSFPDKSEEEIAVIRKKFYENFSDYLVETIKSFSISETESRVRMQHINQEVFHEAKAEGKNIIMLAGHVFNWEWINALARIIPQKHCHPVYRKVNSDFWENQMKKVRNKFGNEALEANEVIMNIFRSKNDGESAYMFVADQTPHVAHVNYGLEFLHQKTPAFIGYDKLATRMDLAFIYCEMKKVKRGYYQVNYHRIYPDGEKFTEHEVVRKFHKLLENTLHKHPDNYLWSHRKWKYQDSIKTFDSEKI
ncbi:lipid A biosynthesis acyltransferase [Chryseobacterium carnipullorum]|uniref:Lipid A biosynthesis acyltransferase n=1 Tax=Chryseobacterium carnipullorum TaxID=1124835 RepID=A0A1M7N475_CHRCU|nr:lysophospholipid acyltransferase family protein [Chryseobacterium carnipullorum]AZA49972.1 lipid A biosynthesis acyltransferase [Chryseobacterium carnipullorum]AZA64851.1 lipid A biosynthesis acyltransferase [Chryseobacterium carnipullorum]SHM97780.1 KDO2-lipid IV(A) lauroyltransferase [Chryseobacterium carnipullorum]STC96446.1 lipid A biosynthesis lauroyl acyltransferase [Chryseobacterium carnipullorum]HBV16536.1 lipid A biosynthesis acyltransferase [Chryseobacterium carnipullorum]